MEFETLQEYLDKHAEKCKEDVERFEKHDSNLCMLCGAYGEDKRSLFISCFYEISEVIPEALDVSKVLSLENRGYYLRICKNCRGEFLDMLGNWRKNMVDRKDIEKDHDGNNTYTDERDIIPVRINGRTVMYTPEEYCGTNLGTNYWE